VKGVPGETVKGAVVFQSTPRRSEPWITPVPKECVRGLVVAEHGPDPENLRRTWG